jgi:hypothetical protein
MTVIYYSGAEIPGWRRVMEANGVHHAALSYMGLRRRTKFINPWTIREKVKEDLGLLLDSGGHTLNAKPDAYPIASIMAHYEQFAAENADAVELVLDLDVVHLGAGARQAHRERMLRAVGDKLVPVWHAEDSLHQLYALAQDYQTIALADTEVEHKDTALVLRELSQQGIGLIGLAMLKPDKIKTLPFTAVTGTSWLSPVQHGETVIYTGGELHRFHAKYQQSARTRYRTQIEAFGLDPAKVADGDGTELLSLSLRSWETFVRELAANHPSTPSERNGVPAMDEPANGGVETRHEPGTTRTRIAMPGVGFTTKPAADGEPGERLLRVVDAGLRTCNSCYLKASCPAHQPDASCAYEIPVELHSPGQIKALRLALIKMQTDRVLFLRMAEELEGGMANPVLSGELDRLSRMMATDHKMDQAEFSFTMRASGGTGEPTLGGGIISQIFGREPAAIEPVAADPLIAQILDAEVVEEREGQ